ncbi:MAG: hypothetical protein IJ570_05635 [Prevotella sp.]|nr:hypothetical protein [Prevotella sp.]
MKKSLLVSVLAALGLTVFAQNTETLTPTADTWVRTDNAAGKYGAQTKLEVKDYVNADEGKDIKFYGIVSFTLNKPEGCVVKSATLRLVTERIKTSRPTSLYYLNSEIDEASVNYTAVQNAITAALATTPVTFTAEGQNGKSVALDEITAEKYQTITLWQNTIDVTSLAKQADQTFSILIAAAASSPSSNNSNCFFTKEQEDFTNSKTAGLSATAAEVTPQLIVEYEEGNGETGEVYSSVVLPAADTYVRKGNTNNYGGAATIEMYTFKDDSSDLDFVGLMGFNLPAAPSDDYELESASLRLVTERAKGSVAIYPYTGSWEENAKYEDQADAIAEARSKEAIATVKLAGQSGKAVTDNGVTQNTVAEWTNTIDLTSYAKSIEGTYINLMMVNPANTKTSVKVYTKEAADVTLKDGTVFEAASLVPQLTVTYKKKGESTAISIIENNTAKPHDGIFTLSGMHVKKMNKGIYIINGKKIIKR